MIFNLLPGIDVYSKFNTLSPVIIIVLISALKDLFENLKR
jgi:hypothetical protein